MIEAARTTRRTFFANLAALALAARGAGARAESGQAPLAVRRVEPPRPLPNLQFVDAERFRGRAVLLNVWPPGARRAAPWDRADLNDFIRRDLAVR